jgi:hypothetical protein
MSAPFQPNPEFRPNSEFQGRIERVRQHEPGEEGDWLIACLVTHLAITWPRISTWTKVCRWVNGQACEASIDDVKPSCRVEIDFPTIYAESVSDLAKMVQGPSQWQAVCASDSASLHRAIGAGKIPKCADGVRALAIDSR